ncbi:MAG: HAMP domain-containing sensor histidine kinase [Acidobacteriota bacterium]|nr:HAMP domain-containing sensor histidine kinase [Acidobacteriota bacterium]
MNKPTITSREGAVTAREQTATVREGAATARDKVADQRDDTASLRDDVAGVRDDAAGLREDTSTLREHAVRAREEAAEARAELELLMVQMREANERLIVGSLRAQTMTEVAEEANHLKDEFLATVSHELRTPLNAIVGWARILAKSSSPELVAQGVAAIERNAWALAHIIDDLLDVSRIAAGTLQMSTQPVDLAAVVRAALETLQPAAQHRHVQLSLTADPATVETVRGDPVRLQQVIWNLLANAIKFTPAGGRVDVSLERSGDFMQIKVVDTGEGIDPDFLPHIFDRFRQGAGATTGRQTGLGLGLSIVRQLVELHHGTVQAVSEGQGRGATFTIRLPISAVEPTTGLQDRRSGKPDRRP